MEQRPPPAPLASIVFRLLRARDAGGASVQQGGSPESRLGEPSPTACSADADLAHVRMVASRSTKQTMFHPSYEMALHSGWRPRGSG
jgi:hypothetical protein